MSRSPVKVNFEFDIKRFTRASKAAAVLSSHFDNLGKAFENTSEILRLTYSSEDELSFEDRETKRDMRLKNQISFQRQIGLEYNRGIFARWEKELGL